MSSPTFARLVNLCLALTFLAVVTGQAVEVHLADGSKQIFDRVSVSGDKLIGVTQYGVVTYTALNLAPAEKARYFPSLVSAPPPPPAAVASASAAPSATPAPAAAAPIPAVVENPQPTTPTGESGVTPLSQPLKEDALTPITCELAEAPASSELPVLEGVSAAKMKGTYHYNLWLPKGYLADPSRHWPCMFVMAPNGSARLGAMAEGLASGGYIVVLLVEAKDGPWNPILGNFLAAHDDVVKRVRIQEGLKFATGFSGGARGSSCFVTMRPGFAGLILQGAGAAFDKTNNFQVAHIRSQDLAVAMTIGDQDKNESEVQGMKRLLNGPRFEVFPFTGRHQWAPVEVFDKALLWVEDQVYAKSPFKRPARPVVSPT